VLTRTCPAWLRLVGYKLVENRRVGGRWEKIPGRVCTVEEIFRLCIEGYGSRVIAQKLNAVPDAHPAWRGDRWKEWAVLGGYQPMIREGTQRKAVGVAIPDYYPSVVSVETFNRACFSLSTRRKCVGRPGKGIASLLTGLIKLKVPGQATPEPMVVRSYTARDKTLRRYLCAASYSTGISLRGKALSCPYDPVEDTVLGIVADLESRPTPRIDLGEDEERELAALEARIGDAFAKYTDPNTPNPSRYTAEIDKMELQKKKLSEALATKRAAARGADAGRPVMDYRTGRDGRTPEEETEARIRLKARLAEMIETVWVEIERVHRTKRKVKVIVQLRDGRRKGAEVEERPAEG
jgi:hypothetical protein